MDKVAYYEELIMEKIALNAARKRMMSGELENMTYVDPKTGIKETAMYTIMNRDGLVPQNNVHSRINAKAKRLADGDIPKNVNTAKGYQKLENPNNLKKSDALGHFRAHKYLGHKNEEVVGKLRKLGLNTKTNRQIGGGQTELDTSTKSLEFTLPSKNSSTLIDAELPEFMKKIHAYYPRAEKILNRNDRTMTASHEISGEAKEFGRRYKINPKRSAKGLDATKFSSHAGPAVLAADQRALRTIGNPATIDVNNSVRDATHYAQGSKHTEGGIMEILSKKTGKPAHMLSYKDVGPVNNIFAAGRHRNRDGTRMSKLISKTPFWDANDKLRYNRKNYDD